MLLDPPTALRMTTLLELRRRGEVVKGSVLHIGSGKDRFRYKKYFPNAKRYRCLDKRKQFSNVHIVADAQSMPQVPDEGEDCLIATFFLHEVPDVDAAMREFRRILRPGGVIFLTFQGFKGTERWGGHQWTVSEVLELAETYFVINQFYTEEIGTLVVAYKEYQPMTEIWFDDGVRSTYNVAYPVMKRRKLTGIVAIITGKVGKTYTNVKRNIEQPCMTVKQLKTLIGEGWEIASHTVTHPFRFDELTLEQTRAELGNSKEWIIKYLDVTPTKFVVPRHLIRKDQMKLAREYYPYIRPLASKLTRYPPEILVYHWVKEKWFEKRLMRDLLK